MPYLDQNEIMRKAHFTSQKKKKNLKYAHRKEFEEF